MSLILEALKKSEANRRLGQAPDLGTPFTPARRGRSPLWAVLVIVVLSACAGLWWFGRGTPAPTPAAPGSSAATAPGRAAAPAQSRQTLPHEDKRILAEAPHSENAQAPAAAGKDKQFWVAGQRHEGSGRMADRPTQQMSQPATAAQPAPASAPAPAVAQPPRARKTTDMRGYAPPHPATAPLPQPHPEAAAPPPSSSAPKLDVPTYFDLPFATRKALPQLSMSMHVYAGDPKQRFVILDGARIVEGDTTADSVTLREIRPDGVILEFQGQRFFFPRDGL